MEIKGRLYSFNHNNRHHNKPSNRRFPSYSKARLNPLRILASALRTRYRDKVGVCLKLKTANPAFKEYSRLIYFFHIIVLIYNIFQEST